MKKIIFVLMILFSVSALAQTVPKQQEQMPLTHTLAADQLAIYNTQKEEIKSESKLQEDIIDEKISQLNKKTKSFNEIKP